MTKTIKNTFGAFMMAGLLAGICALAAPAAEARSEAAIGGNPTIGSTSNCFNEDHGGVRSVCTGWRRWALPVTLDDNHHKTIRVRARGVNGTARFVQCQAWTIDGNGNNVRSSSSVNTVRHDGVTEEVAVGLHPHGFGGTYALCWMQEGTLLRSFHY